VAPTAPGGIASKTPTDRKRKRLTSSPIIGLLMPSFAGKKKKKNKQQ
jgi:hypothetical protein